ncbi:intein-containing exportin-1 precursor [Anaeramoeba ignava]|uniref:Exportin-1 n=1 Tax=Anaeramoeba ignava TaxID=1746090 RepID=A0A9Q0LB23_ANAIG|nr:intein-containing exportin-1 precursor [Anaeramoeba ignava]
MAEQLLNFSEESFNVELLDEVVNALYYGTNEERNFAQEILTKFRDHPDSWKRVDVIIEYSNNDNTKFLAVQILEKTIKFNWLIIPNQHQQAIKEFILKMIFDLSSDDEKMNSNKVLLTKFNEALIEIAKKEWPQNWSSFVQEMINSSQTSETVCENIMMIFKLLSEEIFDFNEGQLTREKTQNLKDSLYNDFSSIYKLCEYILINSEKTSLNNTTLATFEKFLKWIPLGYVYETEIIELLCNKFVSNPDTTQNALQCLIEISLLEFIPNYAHKFVSLFNLSLEPILVFIPPTTDLGIIYENGTDNDRALINTLVVFLSTFLKNHLKTLENSNEVGDEKIFIALELVVSMSRISDIEIFKICLDFWNSFASDLVNENMIYNSTQRSSVLGIGNQTYSANNSQTRSPRVQKYEEILAKVRYIMIENMVKPEEVLIVEDENGELTREYVRDNDTIEIYELMRKTMVLLTHLNYQDMQDVMLDQLIAQIIATNFSWSKLNKVCWAIGSISGSMPEEIEKTFLVVVFKKLLGFCEQKTGKDNKAVIASNIMYVVGQYPRFMRMHWKFLKTIVDKLFEFMHEPHPGIKDMSIHRDEIVILKFSNNKIIPFKIGDFIDAKIKNETNENSLISNGKSFVLFPNDNVEIMSVNQNEKVEWKKITSFSRHPLNDNLIKIKTQTNRTIIATKNHSFVIKKNDKIIPILGSDLQSFKHRLPISKRFIVDSSDVINSINIYNFISSQNQTNPKNKIHFNKEIFLNSKFGFLIGIFISSGKFDSDSKQMEFCSANSSLNLYCWEIFEDIFISKKQFWDSNLVLFFNNLRLFINNLGLEFENKFRSFLLLANESFLSGLLTGYFYQNLIQKEEKLILFSSSQNLSSIIQLILARFEILTTCSKKEKNTDLVYIQIFQNENSRQILSELLNLEFIEENMKFVIEKINKTLSLENNQQEIKKFETIPYIGNISSRLATFFDIELSKFVDINGDSTRKSLQKLIELIEEKWSKKENFLNSSEIEILNSSSIFNFEVPIELKLKIKEYLLKAKNSQLLSKKESIENRLMESKEQINEEIEKDIKSLKQALYSDVFHDLIIDIEEPNLDQQEYVYDISVEEDETFMVNNLMIVHNSCDTFLKISNECRWNFVSTQGKDTSPFINKIINKLSTNISDLENHQKLIFFQALGVMIAQAKKTEKEKLIDRLMDSYNALWEHSMRIVLSNNIKMADSDFCKDLIYILKINSRVALSAGSPFRKQFMFLFPNMLNIYEIYSKLINEIINSDGSRIIKKQKIKNLNSVKKEVLGLIQTFIYKSIDPQMIVRDIIPSLFEIMLVEYKNSLPETRCHEVLYVLTTIVEKVKGLISSKIPEIMESIFESTIQMISLNFEDYPEFRLHFFKLIQTINKTNFNHLFQYTSNNFQVFVDSVIWGVKHNDRNISEIGLQILIDLINNILSVPNIANGFFQAFYLLIIEEIFKVLTDTFHKSGFPLQADIIQKMIKFVSLNQISVPLFDSAQNNLENEKYLRIYLVNFFSNQFSNLNQTQIEIFVDGLFELKQDLPKFKIHLRDFLIQSKEFSQQDNKELFEEEKKRQQQEDLEKKSAIPGLVSIREKPEENVDLEEKSNDQN